MLKTDIHPTYYPDAKIVCSCGTVYTIGSTRKELKVEVCSKCHPFFTGQRRIVDTAGRVERFVKKYNWGQKPTDEVKKGPKLKKGAEEVGAILKELESEEQG